LNSVRLRHRGETREVRLEKGAAVVGDRRIAFERSERDGRLEAIVISGRSHAVVTARDGDRVFVWCEGVAHQFERVRGKPAAGEGHHAGDLVSPMPGRVRRTFVLPGSRVARGEILLTLEAMKMEHSIRAPREGVLRKLHVREGDLVEAGVELAEIS
jgi:3-methylcrotonyl-CoA carboxylase alpha subunit